MPLRRPETEDQKSVQVLMLVPDDQRKVPIMTTDLLKEISCSRILLLPLRGVPHPNEVADDLPMNYRLAVIALALGV